MEAEYDASTIRKKQKKRCRSKTLLKTSIQKKRIDMRHVSIHWHYLNRPSLHWNYLHCGAHPQKSHGGWQMQQAPYACAQNNTISKEFSFRESQYPVRFLAPRRMPMCYKENGTEREVFSLMISNTWGSLSGDKRPMFSASSRLIS